MYHLIIEHLGVKRCLAKNKSDIFKNEMSIDCSMDHACIPSKHLRDITIICTGDKRSEKRAGVFSD